MQPAMRDEGTRERGNAGMTGTEGTAGARGRTPPSESAGTYSPLLPRARCTHMRTRRVCMAMLAPMEVRGSARTHRTLVLCCALRTSLHVARRAAAVSRTTRDAYAYA